MAGYSLALTWIVDLLGKIPGIEKWLRGWRKQVLAGLLAVVYCLVQEVNVFTGAPSVLVGELMTGLLLAAVAGFGWHRAEGWVKNTRDAKALLAGRRPLGDFR